MTEERRERRRGRKVGYLATIIAAIVVAVIAHTWALWQPWTAGVVTADWSRVLWAIDLSVGVQIVANAALLVWNPRLLRRSARLAQDAVAAVSTWVVWTVYPFHLEAVLGVHWVDGVARLGIGIAFFIVCIAVFVGAIRLVLTPFARD